MAHRPAPRTGPDSRLQPRRVSGCFLLSTATAALILSLGRGATAQPVPPPLPDLHVRITTNAPPHPRHEVIAYDARPSKNHVWVKGYWHHNGSDWHWTEGRWSEPPAHHAHWIAAQYHRVHDGYQYVPGHWSTEVVIHD